MSEATPKPLLRSLEHQEEDRVQDHRLLSGANQETVLHLIQHFQAVEGDGAGQVRFGIADLGVMAAWLLAKVARQVPPPDTADAFMRSILRRAHLIAMENEQDEAVEFRQRGIRVIKAGEPWDETPAEQPAPDLRRRLTGYGLGIW